MSENKKTAIKEKEKNYGSQGMKKLVLAEKPSVGRDIARVLNCKQKHGGFYEGKDYIVTWALGHLVTLGGPDTYDKKYEHWNLEDLPIIPSKFTTVVIPQTSKQYRVVKTQMKRQDVKSIVIATDAGREGELVARWIIQKVNPKKPVERLWISSVTDQAILKGFRELKPGKDYEALFYAAIARAEGDWVVGINATRALTTKYNTPLSCGRVQTPTLGMIDQRDQVIQQFKPKKYYGLEALDRGVKFTYLHHKKDKNVFDEKVIDQTLQGLTKTAKVISIEKKNKSKNPKPLYDLTSLQREAHDLYGYSPKETLNIMQKLYEYHKALTYPRTDSKYLTSDIYATIVERLRVVQGDPFRKEAYKLLKHPIKKGKHYIDDQKVTDHHAIIPTEMPVNLSHFTYEERRIYELVVKRFLEVLMPAYTYEETSVRLKVGQAIFETKGNRVLDLGYKVLSRTNKENDSLPLYVLNKTFELTSFNKTSGETKPPARFNEGSLLSAMENPLKFMEGSEDLKTVLSQSGGLGTVATRADIIEKLFKTQVVEMKGKSIFITKKGRQLLRVAPEALKSPKLTAEWEMKLTKIANKALRSETFVNEMKAYTETIVEDIKGSEVTFKHDNISTTPCPVCGQKMLNRESKNGKSLVCPDRGCNHRISVARVTNARCPECHKKLTLRGAGDDKIFVCKCGFKEKLSTFERKKKEGLKKGGKADVLNYKKQQEKEVKALKEKNNPFAALNQLKVDK